MSLYKQLWLTTTCLAVLTFGAVLLVTSLSARQYLEHQLYMKNVDNASALALSVGAARALGEQPEGVLQQQFRRGHYELIELRSAGGELLQRFSLADPDRTVPAWFTRLLPIEVAPGEAQLRAGDEVLTVVSQTAFAYEVLWDSTRALAMIFVCCALIAGGLGTLVLRLILQPLQRVTEQAVAIGERRFISMVEPRCRELRDVARAMNALSARVKSMLQHESVRMEKCSREAHVDELTGLLRREHFLNLFASALAADDEDTAGVITLVRIADLAVLNQVHGRDTLNTLLGHFGTALARIHGSDRGVALGRLSGSEFGILTPGEMDAGLIGREVQNILRETAVDCGLGAEICLPAATTTYRQGDRVGELLAHLDSALLSSEQRGGGELVVMGRHGIQMMPARQELEHWRSILLHGFSEGRFFLGSYPVLAGDGELLHLEAPARLDWRGSIFTAGQFLPWINRLELAEELDQTVVNLALETAARDGRPVGINLSAAAVANQRFLPWLSERLSSHPEAAKLLWLEVQEAAAYRHLEQFKRLCSRCKRYGTRVGIEHLGHRLSDIGRLHDVGVDYVKVDSAFVANVNDNPANQTLLRTLCSVVRSLGITVVAEGVTTEAEWDALQELGFDAATGRAITERGRSRRVDRSATGAVSAPVLQLAGT